MFSQVDCDMFLTLEWSRVWSQCPDEMITKFWISVHIASENTLIKSYLISYRIPFPKNRKNMFHQHHIIYWTCTPTKGRAQTAKTLYIKHDITMIMTIIHQWHGVGTTVEWPLFHMLKHLLLLMNVLVEGLQYFFKLVILAPEYVFIYIFEIETKLMFRENSEGGNQFHLRIPNDGVSIFAVL